MHRSFRPLFVAAFLLPCTYLYFIRDQLTAHLPTIDWPGLSNVVVNRPPATVDTGAEAIESHTAIETMLPTSILLPTSTLAKATPSSTQEPDDLNSKIIVVASTSKENTSWVQHEFPAWPLAIYVVDNSTSHYHTRLNKGREANAYLTYIISHYGSLPSDIFFLHSHATSWHIDNDSRSNAKLVHTLHIEHLRTQGYVNLRCGIMPGCPANIIPYRNPPKAAPALEHHIPEAWEAMFPGVEIPERIGAPCCAQFAVTKDQVLKRPVEDYERIHKWLMETELKDSMSGRVMEFLWHVIFGKDAVHCPDQEQCYCNTFGQHCR